MIVAGHDKDVAEWVARYSPYLKLDTPYTALGYERGGDLIAGVVYDNFVPRVNVDAHVAFASAVPRIFLREAFRYPFCQLLVRRITGRVPFHNVQSRYLCQRLGFQREGVIREALEDGEHLMIFGMLKRECRWL